MRKKVLIIAYYFPPMGGSGVQRPAKFAKYLKDFGWEPVVLVPEPGTYINFDDSLLEELKRCNVRIERVSAKTPFHRIGKKKQQVSDSPAKAKFIKWVTSWFFLPDNKTGWIKPAVDKAVELHSKENFDVVFATAPPYSNCLIAKALKHKTGLPVVMDFRDDWLKSHWIRYPTKWHYRKMESIEKKALLAADALTVVNSRYEESFLNRLPKKKSIPVTVIPNGYDPEDFRKAISSGADNKFSIIHSGRFYSVIQPDTLLRSVALAIELNENICGDLSLQFQGGLSKRHWKLINSLKLTALITDFGYVEHQQAVKNLMNADLLYLTLGKRPNMDAVTPGKLFEYMGSLKPILAHVPDGITASHLRKYSASGVLPLYDIEKGAEAILDFYELWKLNELPSGNEDYAAQFSRVTITEQLACVLDAIST